MKFHALHVQPELVAVVVECVRETVAEVRKQNRDLQHGEQLLTKQKMFFNSLTE